MKITTVEYWRKKLEANPPITVGSRFDKLWRELTRVDCLLQIAKIERNEARAESEQLRQQISELRLGVRRCSRCGDKLPHHRRDYLCSQCHIEYDLELAAELKAEAEYLRGEE